MATDSAIIVVGVVLVVLVLIAGLIITKWKREDDTKQTHRRK